MIGKAFRIFILILVIGVVVVIGMTLLVWLALPLAAGAIVLPFALMEDAHKRQLRNLGWGDPIPKKKQKRKKGD